MVFIDNIQFKQAICKYSIHIKRELKIVKNEPTRIRVKCMASKQCPWSIFASFSKETWGMQVKTYMDEHSCAHSYKNKMVTVKAIAEALEEDIRDNPKLKLKGIKKMVKRQLHAEVNLTRCKRAKTLVRDKISGNYKEEFSMLRDYGDELLDKNPGNTVVISTDRVNIEFPPVFKRMYVCFDALKKGCMLGCRKILGLDGCFLKGPCKGELLSAVGKDGNNQMFPVAWAIVEVECKDSWTWFLDILRSDLNLGDGKGFTIISDKHKV